MWTAIQYRQLVRVSAAYDLLITAPFVTPWTFAWFYSGLTGLTEVLALPGQMPTSAPMHMLMVNMLGSVVCVWSLLRLRDPQARYGRYDALARGLFAIWQAYALWQGVSLLIGFFLLIELAFGLAQALPLRAPAVMRKAEA